MTCIVAVVEKNGDIYMSGDSAGVAGLSIIVRKDPKVFILDEFIFGICGSFRMRDLLMYSFTPPKISKNQDLNDYMRTDFINKLMKVFDEKHFSRKEDNVMEMDGAFLVGVRGRLFEVDQDFQVGEALHKYDAVGCGMDLAQGSLFSTENFTVTPEERLSLALDAACYHNGGVRAPYITLKLPNKSKQKSTKKRK